MSGAVKKALAAATKSLGTLREVAKARGRLRYSDVVEGMRVVCVDAGSYEGMLVAGKTYVVRAKRTDGKTDIWLKGVPLSFRASRFRAVTEARNER